MLYANTTPFYNKGLEHPQILVSEGDSGTNPLRIARDNYNVICQLYLNKKCKKAHPH